MGGTLLLSLKNKSPKSWYRVSVAAHYFIYGLVFASWASRIPDIKQALGMNEAELGGVLFFIPIGQMTGMALSGWLVNKFGSKSILLKGAILYPSMLVLLGLAGTLWQLSIGLFLFGISSNLFNISVNTQAVGVERLYKGSIMASFHGLWSLAGFIGGLISTLMVAMYISPFTHFCIILTLTLLILMAMSGSVLPRDEQRLEDKSSISKNERKKFTLPDKQICILGLIAFVSLVCEGTMFDWSSVYFEEVINPPQNLVRLGYIAAMFSMAGGRFAADSLITRFGVVNILKLSGTTVACGLLLSTVFPTLPTATIGFFLIGLGVSAIVPVTYSLAGRSKTMQPSVAIAIVSSIGFLGFLLGPPVIGFIAHATSLRWAIGSIAIIALLITILAPQLKKEN
ncbi:MFS transporter [Solitalea sp. MAHUQ-68]|uniref:MFS transporter n=1 Tax=Solitalea agri TaxID=2953739 RepID=A0A9X2F4C4_9SPHI|nr:MFS transporter [Solitalea agri]MCO4293974.1 MFS transporter [Solitalea agri]